MNARNLFKVLAVVLTASVVASPIVFAKGKPPTPGGETGANNLSFPLILSDNASPAGLPLDGAWRFAAIDSTQCIDEEGVQPGTPVPSEYVCYYGRQVVVVSETGEIKFVGVPKVWWLQKRTENFWKTLSVGHDASTPLVVSAVDVGDLLESSPSIQARQIRVEFNLLQSVSEDDPELGDYVVTDWTNAIPTPCSVPEAAGESLGCFAALGMSGAVPGTEQSGTEIQGTDFGPGEEEAALITGMQSSVGQFGGGLGNNARGNSPSINISEESVPVPGTQTLLDPTTIRMTTPDVGGINALVYSHCARLVIQKIPDSESPVWDETTGLWSGPSVGDPLVNVATYTGAWTTEITSSGSIVYGYNWNAKTASTGTYRLTMVLDGNDAEGPVCSSTLATKFETPTQSTAGTQLVNMGEANTSTTIIYAGDSDLGDEGGLVYIDVPLTTKGGGGGPRR
ncbi:hypothetical protein E4P82_03505 [Candidatus Competibacter phosphatis]|uniref:Uncharacterized protein n=1 Tax=Candidatus Competibacter phosphatis TaxID=221280 RepID=A0ABX1TKB8_9GAMM|nr:hypothetical protein [Candidatus Competibacter phosphatis]NMQ18345.1 hypothetical protein [Candidatus Competibacter phosphatis]